MVILRDGTVKTRKEHKCHGCCEIIPIGTYTYSQTAVNEGVAYTLYVCDDCRSYCKIRKCIGYFGGEVAYSGFVKDCEKEGQVNV